MYRCITGESITYTHSPNGVKVHSDLFRPCGYCINCRLTKAQNWAIRMTHEAQLHDQKCFITLTYDDQKLPPNSSLRPTDVSAFIKRLRRALDYHKIKKPITYYQVGEYGENLSRPHYHIVLFGYDFSDPIKYLGIRNTRTLSSSKDDRNYYKSTFLNSLWSHGFADLGNVDYSTCLYVAKYVTKKLFGANQQKIYGDLLPESASMSKKNPIGSRWISKYYSDVYPHDYVVLNGKRLKPPPYYDRWLMEHKPDLYSLVKSNREESMTDSFPDIPSLYNTQFIRMQRQSGFLRDGCAPNLITDRITLERKLQYINSLSKGEL